MIECNDLVFIYPDNTVALNKVSFRVSEGECIGIVGPTGSGKSTLLLIISGLLFPTKGRVKYKGKDISKYDALRREVAILFQNPFNQFLTSNVFDEIAYIPRQLGIKEDEIIKIVKYYSHKLGLDYLLNKSPFRISGGEARRLGIAMVLSYNPDVILLDEPFSDLSPKYIKIVKDILKDLKENGKTILLSSHSLHHMLDIVDKLLILNKGKVLAFADIETIIRNDDLIKMADLEIPCYIKILQELGMRDIRPLPRTLKDFVEVFIHHYGK